MFKNGARYLNSETNLVSRDDGRMLSPIFVKFGPRIPESRPEKVLHPLTLDGENVRYRQ